MRKGFTIVEILITLTIIGIVAALIIPNLLADYRERLQKEQVRMIKYKITQATSLMNSYGLIKSYPSTEDFVNTLKDYLKITKICNNSHLNECWPSNEISIPTTSGDFNSINVNSIKTGSDLKSLGLGTKNTNTVGIITTDGTPMILTYSPQCTPLDSYKNYNYTFEDNKPVTNATTNCISAIFDINGSKGPNKLGADIRTWNSVFGAVKMSRNYGTIDDCKVLKQKGLVKYCEVEKDYWVGAVKTCNDIGLHIPSEQTLLNMAGAMFGISNVPSNTAIIYKNTWGVNSCLSVLTKMGYSSTILNNLDLICLSGNQSSMANQVNSSLTKLSNDTWSSKEISATHALDIEFAGSPDILMPVKHARTYSGGDTLCVAD